MDNNQALLCIGDYSFLLKEVSNLMELTLSEIRNKYKSFPHSIIDNQENDTAEKLIEIRLDKQKITLTCTFNTEGKCKMTCLFADENEIIENFIGYLKKEHVYDYIKGRWLVPGYCISVKETNYLPYEIYMLFY